MNDDFKRSMVAFARAREDLANFRQWYYSQSVGERQRFKEEIQALVEASKPFAGSCLTVELNYHQNSYCPQDGASVSVKASHSPKEILEAIGDWDKADEQSPSFDS